MTKNKTLILDEFEQELEDEFENLVPVENMEAEMALIQKAATEHIKKKKTITIRIHPNDLKIMQLKASKLGIPYQTYINMLIHKDACSGF
jgi:predicted DNA binding CopG/RHH family protein